MTNAINNQKNYAVVDYFGQKTHDIDGDGIPDITHGQLVESYIKAINPDANITRYNVETPAGLTGALNDLNTNIQNGQKFDGVNMSLANNRSIPDLAKWTNMNLTPDNINQQKGDLRNALDDYGINNPAQTSDGRFNPSTNPFQTDLQQVKAIENITSQGVPVYISAGNKAPDIYNTLGLAKGSTLVGSTNQFLNLDNFAQNSDVQRNERALFFSDAIKDPNGKTTGYDVTGDGKADFTNADVSSKGASDPVNTYFSGTSLSTPIALAKDTTTNVPQSSSAAAPATSSSGSSPAATNNTSGSASGNNTPAKLPDNGTSSAPSDTSGGGGSSSGGGGSV